MNIKKITDNLVRDLKSLKFESPISHVYNPLEYARKPHDLYFELYGQPPRQVLFLGMNPGPWGMAQTGVPFGEVDAVKNWLKIEAPVGKPAGEEHPKRPVEGFSCPKSEVSGKRLWGWAKDRFGTPDRFFSRFFVANYCPLLFIEKSGRNKTPSTIPVDQRKPLLKICDRALKRTVDWFNPEMVIGVGAFAHQRAAEVLSQTNIRTGRITHPSPANPKANQGWVECITEELSELGVL